MTDDTRPRRSVPRWSVILIALALALLAVAATVYAVTVQNARGKAPKRINQPTAAREVRPFTSRPDNRFAPLPLERQKQDK